MAASHSWHEYTLCAGMQRQTGHRMSSAAEAALPVVAGEPDDEGHSILRNQLLKSENKDNFDGAKISVLASLLQSITESPDLSLSMSQSVDLSSLTSRLLVANLALILDCSSDALSSSGFVTFSFELILSF